MPNNAENLTNWSEQDERDFLRDLNHARIAHRQAYHRECAKRHAIVGVSVSSPNIDVVISSPEHSRFNEPLASEQLEREQRYAQEVRLARAKIDKKKALALKDKDANTRFFKLWVKWSGLLALIFLFIIKALPIILNYIFKI